MKKLLLIFNQLVLLLMLVITSITPVSAKVASGIQELGGGLSQGQTPVESLPRLGSSDMSMIDALGSPLVPKGATNPANGVKLNKQLGSQQQLSEVGVPVAGAVSKTPLRDAPRLSNQYGGNTADWTKKPSSQPTESDQRKFETHWYENSRIVQRVESKMIVEDYLKGPN